jgi:hypothetical protein
MHAVLPQTELAAIPRVRGRDFVWGPPSNSRDARPDAASTLLLSPALIGVRLRRADLPGLPADGLLGADVFRTHVVCIDRERAQIVGRPRLL